MHPDAAPHRALGGDLGRIGRHRQRRDAQLLEVLHPSRLVREVLADARTARAELAAAYEPVNLYRRGFRLYEQLRPGVPAGASGWGALGELDRAMVQALAP